MATWPSGSKASTTNLDAGTDSPILARADIYQNVQNVNEIIDMFNISSPSDNQILKYNTSNQRFELAASTGETLTIVGDDSTGTAVTLGETFKIAGSGGVTTAVSGDTLTITGPTGTLSNVVEDTTPQLGGDLDLNTFTVNGTGNISITGNIATDAVTVNDNVISSARSNDHLIIKASGTGSVALGDGPLGEVVPHTWLLRQDGTGERGVTRAHYVEIDADSMNVAADRYYANNDSFSVKLTGSGSGDSDERFRSIKELSVDLAGYNLVYNDTQRHQSVANIFNMQYTNTTSTASQAVQGVGCQGGVTLLAQSSGNITVTEAMAMNSFIDLRSASGATVDVTNGYGQYVSGVIVSGAGTETIDNFYGLYVKSASPATNNYGLYIANDSWLTRAGTFEAYREKVVDYTDDSSSSITIDCSASPISTITLNNTMEIVFDNLVTGQTHTIIITNGGSNNATFYTGNSNAVKFAGGAPTITSGSGSIDVVTVFNDGTRVLGNIAQAFV